MAACEASEILSIKEAFVFVTWSAPCQGHVVLTLEKRAFLNKI